MVVLNQRIKHRFASPVTLLGRDIRRRWDPVFGIDQEQHDDLAVTRLGRVDELEWRQFMLIDVWEGNAPIRSRLNRTKNLVVWFSAL